LHHVHVFKEIKLCAKPLHTRDNISFREQVFKRQIDILFATSTYYAIELVTLCIHQLMVKATTYNV